jgi:myo-inositol 2-dehydrogenase/D-chiro-inositol 1-dehydrogenase
MTDASHPSRRDFLTTSAKLAGIAGLASAAGCAETGTLARFEIQAGPTPKRFTPHERIRVGLIGVGSRGQQDLKPTLERKDVEIVAIADPHDRHRNQTAASVKEKLNQEPELYSGEEDWKRLLERDDVDAVQLATYPVQHAEMYLGCFAAGKHFYGEKPMCVSVAEADALVAAQKKNPDLIAQIGFQRRANPRYQDGIQRVHDGEIGDLFTAYAAWNLAAGDEPLGLPKQGTRVWFGRREMSGDWMIEQACHTWDVLNWVAGKLPLAASGIGQRNMFDYLDPKRDVTDMYLAHLHYPDDWLIDYSHNWLSPRKDGGRVSGVYERVCGMKGAACLDEGKIFWRDPKRDPVQLPGKAGEPTMTFNSVNAFYEALHANRKPVSTVENGRLATLVGLLVRKAVDDRRKVKMTEIM